MCIEVLACLQETNNCDMLTSTLCVWPLTCLQDICPGSDEVIIVTSSLMKDINSKVELYR